MADYLSSNLVPTWTTSVPTWFHQFQLGSNLDYISSNLVPTWTTAVPTWFHQFQLGSILDYLSSNLVPTFPTWFQPCPSVDCPVALEARQTSQSWELKPPYPPRKVRGPSIAGGPGGGSPGGGVRGRRQPSPPEVWGRQTPWNLTRVVWEAARAPIGEHLPWQGHNLSFRFEILVSYFVEGEGRGQFSMPHTTTHHPTSRPSPYVPTGVYANTCDDPLGFGGWWLVGWWVIGMPYYSAPSLLTNIIR